MRSPCAGLGPGFYTWHRSGYNQNGGKTYGGSGPGNIVVGRDFPALKLRSSQGILPITSRLYGGNWYLLTCGPSPTEWQAWIYQHCAIPNPSGIISESGHGNSTSALLTPSQAMMLDNKMDDGIPSSGSVMAVRSGWDSDIYRDDVANKCVTTSAGKNYNLKQTDRTCSPIVKMQ